MKFILLLCFAVLSTLSIPISVQPYAKIMPEEQALLLQPTRYKSEWVLQNAPKKILAIDHISRSGLELIKRVISQLKRLITKYTPGPLRKVEVIKIDGIKITEKVYIGEGSQGTAFNVRVERKVNGKITKEDAVLKTSKPNARDVKEQFQNEVNALKKTGMLIAFDERTLTVVQKKVEGTSLDKLLLGDIDSQRLSILREKYDKLSQDFIDKHGLVHGDIRPGNVIVDSADNLHLIDFGKTKEASKVRNELDDQQNTDRSVATREWEFIKESKLVIKVTNNIDTAHGPNEIQILKDYSAILKERGNMVYKNIDELIRIYEPKAI